MEVQRGKGSEMETETEKSVSLALFSAHKVPRIDLEEVSMSETIEGIIVRALTKELQMRNLTAFDYTRVGVPELLAICMSSKKDGKKSSEIAVSSEDQNQTLREFLSAAGYFSSSSKSPIKVQLIPSWERSFLMKKMQKRRERDRDRCRCRDRDRYRDDDESSCSDDELDTVDVDSIVDKQRPKVLAENKNVLRVRGRLRVHFQDKNGIVKCHLVDYFGQLRCEPKDVVKLDTPAKRVVLVFSEENYRYVDGYFSYLDHDTTINRYDELLILLVTWDKFSYWLLRMLRKTIGSQVPIIAFTDADIHQLDLLAFLDTPPQKLSEHYGWNDCADLGAGLVDAVDIKWAGLRPSEDHSPSARDKPVSDYAIICDFLEQQGKWPLEIQCFRKYQFYNKRLSSIQDKPKFHPLNPYIWKEYIPQKLEKKDWI